LVRTTLSGLANSTFRYPGFRPPKAACTLGYRVAPLRGSDATRNGDSSLSLSLSYLRKEPQAVRAHAPTWARGPGPEDEFSLYTREKLPAARQSFARLPSFTPCCWIHTVTDVVRHSGTGTMRPGAPCSLSRPRIDWSSTPRAATRAPRMRAPDRGWRTNQGDTGKQE